MKKNGFTLTELIIVVISVGILASIAGTVMSGITNKAIKQEAYAALNLIRTAEKMYYIKYGAYRFESDFGNPHNPLADFIPPNALDGVYFSVSCYGVNGLTPPYVIHCSPSYSGAPQGNKVRGWRIIIYMYPDGSVIERSSFAPPHRILVL